MRTQQPTNTDDIDLLSIGSAIRRVLPKALLTSALIGAGTFGVMTTMLPKFTSQAQLQVVASEPGSTSTVTTDPAAVATHVRALQSTDLAVRLIRELDLAKAPEFNNALPATDLFTRVLQTIGLDKPKATESDDDRARRAFYNAMRVSQGRETRAINVEFTSSDSQLSADAANRLAEIYKESLATRTVTGNDEEARRLRPMVERVRQELAQLDGEAARFRVDSDLQSIGPSATPQTSQALQDLIAEQTKAANIVAEAEARARTARDQMQVGTAEANPDVQKSQLIPRLSEQRIRLERQVSELSASLLPAHPRMRQVHSELVSLQRQIKEEVRKLVDSLERDAKISRDRLNDVVRRINETKQRGSVQAPNEARLKGLEDAARNKRAELERLDKDFLTAVSKGTAPTARVGVEIVQKAIPSNEKTFPKPGFFGSLVALASLLVGLAWTVTREIVTGPRSTGADTTADERVEREVREPVGLPMPPAIVQPQNTATATAPPAPPPPPVKTTPEAPEAPLPRARPGSVAAIAADLLERTKGQAGFRSLIAGEVATIDAAAEAISLAKALSAGGRPVVLVEWSTGTASLADAIGGIRSPGMGQLLQGDAAFDDVIQKLADTEAHFIPAGDPTGDAASIFDPDRANLLLDALDEAYDHIVVYGSHQVARDLFQAIQGRFDVGVVVNEAKRGVKPGQATAFLGFEVSDMDVFRIERETSAIQTRRIVPTSKPATAGEARA